MRRIVRPNLPPATQMALDGRQEQADEKRATGTLDIEKEWKGARQTKPLKKALGTLKRIAGVWWTPVLRQRFKLCAVMKDEQ